VRLLFVFSGLLVVLCGLSLLSGPATTWVDILRILSGDLSLVEYWSQNSSVFELRLVHVVLAAAVGFALSSGGRAMQLYLQNPLADPHVTGLSAGSTSAVFCFYQISPILICLTSFRRFRFVHFLEQRLPWLHSTFSIAQLCVVGESHHLRSSGCSSMPFAPRLSWSSLLD
jgi:ABC-type Fe3+-siderophore transport system permease subunit